MAAETKIVPILDSASFPQEGELEIVATYDPNANLPDTLYATINEEDELLVRMKRDPQRIDYTIDGEGSLILTTTSGDEDKYSINNEGELIYTE